MSEADDLKSKIRELQGINEQQNQQLQQSSSITNESLWMEPPQVYRVSPKLPHFWANKPAVWFSQAESQFALEHMTSDATKFHYIVANLDSRYAAEIDDIVTNPPTTGMHLRSLTGDIGIKPTLLRSLLLQRLPLHVQALLQGQSPLEPDQMADMADRIMEVPLLTSMPSVSSINPMVASASPSVSVILESLAEMVEDLAKQVKLLQTRSSSRPLSNSFRRRFSGSPRRNLASHGTADSRMCHYHQRFQEKARNCIKPCNFSKNAHGSQ
ncbi:hypothetical protein TNIN_383321 [Trichonephila inaurata madagascariensis]|uniref:DUF7041 domain-containing protein n=1 Tax=Trichonephila inaurata madagascariensis TaxID=2747483 RepID=A0A8X6Y4I3_9ARAC|nr:hypothetical protein TNIN_383321 [Trichonephila inaurata madagascariensis]